MDFEPTLKYLASLLASGVGEEEANRLVREAAFSAGFTPSGLHYKIDDFIKICEKLKDKGGRAKIVGLTGVTQARCYRTLRGMDKKL
jgi:hypothetical protein